MRDHADASILCIAFGLQQDYLNVRSHVKEIGGLNTSFYFQEVLQSGNGKVGRGLMLAVIGLFL